MCSANPPSSSLSEHRHVTQYPRGKEQGKPHHACLIAEQTHGYSPPICPHRDCPRLRLRALSRFAGSLLPFGHSSSRKPYGETTPGHFWQHLRDLHTFQVHVETRKLSKYRGTPPRRVCSGGPADRASTCALVLGVPHNRLGSIFLCSHVT